MKAVLITTPLVLGTVLLGAVASQHTAGSFIAILPIAQAECDYVQAVVAQLHTEVQQADRLARESTSAHVPSNWRTLKRLRSLQGKLERVEAAIDRTEDALLDALEAMRAKHGTPPVCLQQVVFTP